MIIYNVTVNVDESILEAWMEWMQKKHIPAMLETGKFTRALMTQVMVQEEQGGFTFSVQYACPSKELLELYYREDANRLRSEAQERFGNSQLAFRTELQVIGQFSI